MKTEIWNGHEIRFVSIKDEWWAVAKDITKALGIKNTSRAMQVVKEKHKGLHTVKGLNRADEPVNIIDEIGIYQLIFKSRKKEAEEFQDWVYQLLKTLRKQSGLEGFAVFRMLDKDHQKQAMEKISQLKKPTPKHYIKANTIANKITSDMFGYPKMIKKGDMTPEMLKQRQPILDDAIELMRVKDEFDLDISVSQSVRSKYQTNHIQKYRKS